jgi:GTP-binding protein
LTDTKGYDAEGTVCARDGSIVFTSTRDGDIELYRMDHDGKNVRRLTNVPGYGFARVPPGVQARWQRLLETYLAERASLVGLMLTVDIRRGLTPLDEQLLSWLAPRQLPVAFLLTKADKMSRGAGLRQLQQVAQRAGQAARLTRFSSISGDGVTDARGWLEGWLA